LEEGEVRQRYQDELQRHVRPEAVSVAVLRLEWHPKATEEKKAESLAAANQLRARAQQQALPGGFGALAEAHSTHQSTRYKGGELGWQTRAQLDALLGDPALVNAALALQQPGEISQPLPGRDGLHLFKLIGRRFAQSVPFEERRAAIQHQLSIERQREREARVVREAQQGLAVTMNRELAATFKPVKTNTIVPPPAMPKP
jgi:parvulin-like peptidyl-prolyl isomerase